MLESGGYMQKDEFKKYQEIVGTSEKEIMKLVNQSTYINIDKNLDLDIFTKSFYMINKSLKLEQKNYIIAIKNR